MMPNRTAPPVVRRLAVRTSPLLPVLVDAGVGLVGVGNPEGEAGWREGQVRTCETQERKEVAYNHRERVGGTELAAGPQACS